ncbi:MAG: BMP family ABC transporter substrate-binding protein [Stellaceae bacterium]
MIKRRDFMIGAGGAVAATAMLGKPYIAHAAEPMKAAWIFVGPTGDMGYSYQHDLGRKAVQKHYGDKVHTIKVESVPEGADCTRVLTQLAQQGCKIIFATSFGYMDSVIKVAKMFPAVYFEHATGYKRAHNVATYNIRFYEGRTIQGTLAGYLTKSGIIGYVGSVPIPEVVQGVDAFTLALAKVNKKARVKIIYVNAWFDPGKEAAAAKTLIAQGADIMCQHTDSPAPVQTAEAHDVWSFGQSSNMAKFGPTHCVTSSVDNWTPYYLKRVGEALDGTWHSTNVWGGIGAGMLEIPPFNKHVPANIRAAGMKVLEGVKDHTILPFEGPVMNQSGKIMVAAGKNMPDSEILGLNWYVPGIEGKLPG